jgi:hypothetical protein
MFKHIKASRLRLLLRIWWLERNAAILADQSTRVHVAQCENDIELSDAYTSLRKSLPPPQQLLREVNHG